MDVDQHEIVVKPDPEPYTHPLLSHVDDQNSVFDGHDADSISERDMSVEVESLEDDVSSRHRRFSSIYKCSDVYLKPFRPSIIDKLPSGVIEQILQYVDQFDLVNLLMVNKQFCALASERLYKRVTVILNAEFPVRYQNNSRLFIRDNGLKHMNTALILRPQNLIRFLNTLYQNPDVINRVKFFVFDKCNPLEIDSVPVGQVQNKIIDFFGCNSSEIHFLHITFVEFLEGIEKLTEFLQYPNVRNKIFKLFVTEMSELQYPKVPQSLTNLFLMLNEEELMNTKAIDLSKAPYDFMYSLMTLTCSTNHQFGLEIVSKFKLLGPDLKLNLNSLTVYHCHKENLTEDENSFGTDLLSSDLEHSLFNEDVKAYLEGMDKKLNFKTLESKINLSSLENLYLKIDCNEHRNSCNCFRDFFNEFARYSEENNGLPNLQSFEVELFPNLEWLRPHQILEDVLVPLSSFITSISNLSRLTIDLSTPGLKMFDNSMGMSSRILNRLNERLMEAFFLRFFTASHNKTRINLRTLQLPDFLTSFIYYKPDFYESLLHTCKCWGCHLVLEKLKEYFHPLHEEDDDMEDEDTHEEDTDVQSTYYILIGFILGKLQADREVCVPIKQKSYSYKNYPIYKGSPNTLHKHFHRHGKCKCNADSDPDGKDPLNIDNLVTTYIVHQLRPIVSYIPLFFFKLESLRIHGIYYEARGSGMVPIFDDSEYPAEFMAELKGREEYIMGQEPDVPFGRFRR